MNNFRFSFRHRMVNGCSEYWLCEKEDKLRIKGQSCSDEFLQFIDIAARDGNGIMAMAHHELHGTGIRGDLFHLTEIDHKGTMTTDYHRISL